MLSQNFVGKLKAIVNQKWPLRFLILLFLRPKRFLFEFVYPLVDFSRFVRSSKNYRGPQFIVKDLGGAAKQPSLLVVLGNDMNIQWCQLWCILGSCLSAKKAYRRIALSSKNRPIKNLYFRVFGFELFFIEDLTLENQEIPFKLQEQIQDLTKFLDIKEFMFEDVPLGSMALSTHSRTRVSGIVDVEDPQTLKEVKEWLVRIYQWYRVGQSFYSSQSVRILFFTEVFMEEYGALYYAALHKDLNIIRFAGTVRDDAVIIQRLTRKSDRTHHAAVTDETWQQLLSKTDSSVIDQELKENFENRYGTKWQLSLRNQPNTRIVSGDVARRELGIPSDRKVGIIYSHILYDTLFFIGKDLFESYAKWFIESVKAACSNEKIDWYIKVHPSNLWRGELNHYLNGKYEEVALIEKYVGELPSHVKLIYPDTPYSPYTWFQLCDFGITVRGTSGIELGALGKTVITAGTGRYEKIGFTINPRTADEYLDLLRSLPSVMPLTDAQVRLGVKFAYLTFCAKPYTLDFFEPIVRFGKKNIFSSDDLVYLAKHWDPKGGLPLSITRFTDWIDSLNEIDLLNPWPCEISNERDEADPVSCPGLHISEFAT